MFHQSLIGFIIPLFPLVGLASSALSAFRTNWSPFLNQVFGFKSFHSPNLFSKKSSTLNASLILSTESRELSPDLFLIISTNAFCCSSEDFFLEIFSISVLSRVISGLPANPSLILGFHKSL